MIALRVERKILRLRASQYLVKDSCGSAVTLCQNVWWLCLHLVRDWRAGHCHISQRGLWYFSSSGICLFWWPESQEIKDKIPECLKTWSKMASLSGPQFPQR